MFPEDHSANHDVFVCDSTKDLDRSISKNNRKRVFLNSLLQKRCQFCSANIVGSGNCRNCCLPVFQKANTISAKKLTKNQIYNNNNNRPNSNERGTNRGFGKLGHSLCDIFLDTPSSSSSEKETNGLSLSRSARSLVATGRTTPQPTTSSNLLSVPEPMMHRSNTETGFVTTEMPSAPNIGYVLYNNEEEADVVFLVGTQKNHIWRFPAHLDVLKSHSPFFAALANNKENNNNLEMPIDWCEPEIFQLILKFIYTDEIGIKSARVALSLFNASNSFFLLPLSKRCLTFLNENCNADNVLEILSFFHNFFKVAWYKNDKLNQSNIESNIDNILELINQLIDKCYTVVDANAQTIIVSEEFTHLNRHLVESILQRDTLVTNNEEQVFEAINLWACQRCKKKHRELTEKNKRELLDKLIYLPRYLTLTVEEFNEKINKSDLLTAEDRNALLRTMITPSEVLPAHMHGFKLDIPRGPLIGGDKEESKCVTKQTKDLQTKTEKRPKNKKSTTRKIMKGIGDIMILIIQVLD